MGEKLESIVVHIYFFSFIAVRGIGKKEIFSFFVVNFLLCESEIWVY